MSDPNRGTGAGSPEDFDLLDASRRAPVHFMGVGGAGMSALASLVVEVGGAVTGCDRKITARCRRLEERGIRLHEGHDPAHVTGCSALVITAAIPRSHPEIEAARAAGIPVLKRAEALGAVVNRGRVVAVSGTHGKTTTSALIGAALGGAGMNPTAIVGGRIPDWDGNLLAGGDELFVVEADEFDRSFHTLRPELAVITTLEADHLDIYGSLEAVEEAFHEFLASVAEEGRVIACADDSGVGRILPRVEGSVDRVLTYGTSAGSMLRAVELKASPAGSTFRVLEQGKDLGTISLRIPGTHNVRNALAAVAVARQLGADWTGMREGLAGFGGIDRRFERVGEAGGVIVVDDYAHHPTEIAATLDAARGAFPDRRIVAVFQPHLYSRTRDFAAAFGRSLNGADVAVVTDIYPAREEPIEGVTGKLVADAADADRVVYVEDRGRVTKRVLEILRSGDLCLTLGAGDLDDVAREVVAELGGEGGR